VSGREDDSEVKPVAFGQCISQECIAIGGSLSRVDVSSVWADETYEVA
jgi:hypothetical protein